MKNILFLSIHSSSQCVMLVFPSYGAVYIF